MSNPKTKSKIKLKVENCSSFLSGIKGLIGSKKSKSILIKTRFGIHTFGVKYPIDVLVLDKKNKVVRSKESLKPCKIFIWNPKYNKVIELPKGEIRKNNIGVGDSIITSP